MVYSGEDRARISAAMQEWRVRVGGDDSLIPESVRGPYMLLHATNLADVRSVVSPGSTPQGENASQAAAALIALQLRERDQGASAALIAATPSPFAAAASPWTDPNAAAVAESAAESARRIASVVHMTQQEAEAAGFAEAARQNAIYNGPAVQQVLEERRTAFAGGIPIRSIDDMGGHAEFTQVDQEGNVSFLGGLVGGAAKFLTGGAKALLESRRDTGMQVTQYTGGDPRSVPGMPSYQSAVPDWFPGGTPWNPVKAATDYVTSTYQAGTNAAAAVLGQGQRGVIMGAIEPKRVSRNTLVCPPKYVLGVDQKCYPKSMLPRSARKWLPDPKPVVSRSDQKAITRAASAKKRLVKLTNAAGAHATITRPHRHATNGKKK